MGVAQTVHDTSEVDAVQKITKRTKKFKRFLRQEKQRETHWRSCSRQVHDCSNCLQDFLNYTDTLERCIHILCVNVNEFVQIFRRNSAVGGPELQAVQDQSSLLQQVLALGPPDGCVDDEMTSRSDDEPEEFDQLPQQRHYDDTESRAFGVEFGTETKEEKEAQEVRFAGNGGRYENRDQLEAAACRTNDFDSDIRSVSESHLTNPVISLNSYERKEEAAVPNTPVSQVSRLEQDLSFGTGNYNWTKISPEHRSENARRTLENKIKLSPRSDLSISNSKLGLEFYTTTASSEYKLETPVICTKSGHHPKRVPFQTLKKSCESKNSEFEQIIEPTVSNVSNCKKKLNFSSFQATARGVKRNNEHSAGTPYAWKSNKCQRLRYSLPSHAPQSLSTTKSRHSVPANASPLKSSPPLEPLTQTRKKEQSPKFLTPSHLDTRHSKQTFPKLTLSRRTTPKSLDAKPPDSCRVSFSLSPDTNEFGMKCSKDENKHISSSPVKKITCNRFKISTLRKSSQFFPQATSTPGVQKRRDLSETVVTEPGQRVLNGRGNLFKSLKCSVPKSLSNISARIHSRPYERKWKY